MAMANGALPQLTKVEWDLMNRIWPLEGVTAARIAKLEEILEDRGEND